MPRQQCQNVPRQQCQNVPRQVPKQECRQIPRQQCQNVPRQQCNNVPRQVPRYGDLSLSHSLTHTSVLGRSATAFPVNSAQTFPASSVTMFPDSSAGTFPLRSVPTFLARSAATFPGSSASRSLSRCVRPPSQATETESRGLQSQQKSFPRNWVDLESSPSQPISLSFHHLPYLFRHYLILHEAFINTRKYILK